MADKYAYPVFGWQGDKNESLSFREAKAGYRLENMPTYPSDMRLMPQFQISPDQRLCFYSWPDRFYWLGNEDITRMQMQANPPETVTIDKELGNPGAGQFIDNIVNPAGYFFGVPVIPTDEYLVKKYVAEGAPTQDSSLAHQGTFNVFTGGFVGSGNYLNRRTVASMAAVNTGYPPGGYFSPWTGLNIVSVNGVYVYRQVGNYNMLWLNVQYQIDKLFSEPYCVKQLVPYGQAYNKFVKELLPRWFDDMKGKRNDKLELFLSNVNFCFPPESHKTFWDKLLSATPLVVATVFMIVSAGAGTPALVAIVAGYFGSLALKDWQNKMGIEADLFAKQDQGKKEKFIDLLRKSGGGGDDGAEMDMMPVIVGGAVLLLLLLKDKR